jgi:hypothetical protein
MRKGSGGRWLDGRGRDDRECRLDLSWRPPSFGLETPLDGVCPWRQGSALGAAPLVLTHSSRREVKSFLRSPGLIVSFANSRNECQAG